MLREHLARKAPAAQAFNVPPETAKMMRIDLAAAGVDYRDVQGRVLDFHALRHTFITNIANSGAPIRTIVDLARHADPRLTISRYMHSEDPQRVAALAALPDLPTIEDEPAATGTGA